MKRFRLLLIFVLSYFATIANNSIDSNIKWISNEDAYVTTIANAIIYEIPYTIVYHPQLVKNDDKYIIRKVISYENYLQKIIKKPKSYKVRGFANNVADLNYDTYAVEIKGKIYLLPSKYVDDNSIIDKINQELIFKRNSYISRINAFVHKRDSLKAKYLPICEREYQRHSQLRSSLPIIIDSIEKKLRTEWYNSIPKSAQNAYKLLAINSFHLHSQNSVGGCNLSFDFTNKSSKTIKYLYVNCSFFNAVNDIVSCTARYSKIFDGVVTGPVYTGEKSGGLWDCVIYNWSAKYAKINSITICYLDNTSISIDSKDIDYLLKSPDVEDIFGYSYIKTNVGKYEAQLSSNSKQIEIWYKRINNLKNNSFFEASKGELGIYKSLFSHLYKLEYDREILNDEFEDFKTRNFMK